MKRVKVLKEALKSTTFAVKRKLAQNVDCDCWIPMLLKDKYVLETFLSEKNYAISTRKFISVDIVETFDEEAKLPYIVTYYEVVCLTSGKVYKTAMKIKDIAILELLESGSGFEIISV